MNRRGFLRGILGTVVAAVVPAPILKLVLPNKQIDMGFVGPMGMVEPIRRTMDYQAIGRCLLNIEPPPEGVIARYKKDVAARSGV